MSDINNTTINLVFSGEAKVSKFPYNINDLKNYSKYIFSFDNIDNYSFFYIDENNNEIEIKDEKSFKVFLSNYDKKNMNKIIIKENKKSESNIIQSEMLGFNEEEQSKLSLIQNNKNWNKIDNINEQNQDKNKDDNFDNLNSTLLSNYSDYKDKTICRKLNAVCNNLDNTRQQNEKNQNNNISINNNNINNINDSIKSNSNLSDNVNNEKPYQIILNQQNSIKEEDSNINNSNINNNINNTNQIKEENNNNSIENLNSKIKSLEEKLVNMELENSKLKQQNETYQIYFSKFETEKSQLEKEKSELKKQNEMIQSNFSKIQIEKKELEKNFKQQIESSRNELIFNKNNINNINIANEKLKSDILYLRLDFENKEKIYNKKLNALKLENDELKKQKILDENSKIKTVHKNTKCEHCFMEPIIGNRYKCSQCYNYNLCQKCYEKNAETGTHQDFFQRIKIENENNLNNNQSNNINYNNNNQSNNINNNNQSNNLNYNNQIININNNNQINNINYNNNNQINNINYNNQINNINYNNNKNNNFKQNIPNYSYKCLTTELKKAIFKGRSEATKQIILQNDSKYKWPENTKLILDRTNSQLQTDDISLKSLNPSEKEQFDIHIKNLQNLHSGEYKIYFDFTVNGQIYGNKLCISLIIKNENEKEIINQFRMQYKIPNDYKDESISKFIELTNGNFEEAYFKLYFE